MCTCTFMWSPGRRPPDRIPLVVATHAQYVVPGRPSAHRCGTAPAPIHPSRPLHSTHAYFAIAIRPLTISPMHCAPSAWHRSSCYLPASLPGRRPIPMCTHPHATHQPVLPMIRVTRLTKTRSTIVSRTRSTGRTNGVAISHYLVGGPVRAGTVVATTSSSVVRGVFRWCRRSDRALPLMPWAYMCSAAAACPCRSTRPYAVAGGRSWFRRARVAQASFICSPLSR